jgi:hypothetical protein
MLEYFVIIVSDYEQLGVRIMEETDAMVYTTYPLNDHIKLALDTYKAKYARVEKRYKLVENNE